MSNNENNEQQVDAKELRKMAVTECGQWLDRIMPLLSDMEQKRDTANQLIMSLHESRMTWLERAANVIDVDVRRGVFDGHFGLYWSDVDGNILQDEETGKPVLEMTCIGDLYKCLTTKDDALTLAKDGEEDQAEVVQ